MRPKGQKSQCIFGAVLDIVSGNASSSAIARLTGANHSCISRYRDGSRIPDRERIERLVRGLRLNASEERMLYHAAGYLTRREQATFNRQYQSRVSEEEE